MSGVAGFCIAILIIIAIPIVLPTAHAGTLRILITDDPANLQHLNLTIDDFAVRNGNGGWTTIPLPTEMISFDLLQFQDVAFEAVTTQLAPGRYTMIRMHVKEGFAYTNATLTTGDEISIRVPSEDFRINIAFEITVDKTTTIILDIQVDTISIAENPEHNFQPIIKATLIPQNP